MSTDINAVIHYPVDVAASVAYTGTAGTINQVSRGGSVMMWATTDAYFNVGATATATNGTPVPAFTPIWLPINSVPSGQPLVISAIQISAGGTVYAQQFN